MHEQIEEKKTWLKTLVFIFQIPTLLGRMWNELGFDPLDSTTEDEHEKRGSDFGGIFIPFPLKGVKTRK